MAVSLWTRRNQDTWETHYLYPAAVHKIPFKIATGRADANEWMQTFLKQLYYVLCIFTNGDK